MASALIPTLQSPPARAMRLASDDPDEVTSWVARYDGHHSRVIHGSGPYGFELARVGTPRVQVAWARTRLPQTLHACFTQPTLQVALAGVQRYRTGRQCFDAPAGTMTFLSTGTVASRFSEGDPVMAIDFEPATLGRELASRRGRDGAELARVPLAIDIMQSGAAAIAKAIAALVDAHAMQPPPATLAHAESSLLDALATVLAGNVDQAAARIGRHRMRLLEDWIDANLAEPLTLGRLCEAGQVGARSLQTAFLARRGMSPMRFVTERRLAAVQRQLSRGDAGDSVTSIAVRLGFTHLGRFSAAYRATFGESPSRTLARSRRRRAREPAES